MANTASYAMMEIERGIVVIAHFFEECRTDLEVKW